MESSQYRLLYNDIIDCFSKNQLDYHKYTQFILESNNLPAREKWKIVDLLRSLNR